MYARSQPGEEADYSLGGAHQGNNPAMTFLRGRIPQIVSSMGEFFTRRADPSQSHVGSPIQPDHHDDLPPRSSIIPPPPLQPPAHSIRVRSHSNPPSSHRTRSAPFRGGRGRATRDGAKSSAVIAHKMMDVIPSTHPHHGAPKTAEDGGVLAPPSGNSSTNTDSFFATLPGGDGAAHARRDHHHAVQQTAGTIPEVDGFAAMQTRSSSAPLPPPAEKAKRWRLSAFNPRSSSSSLLPAGRGGHAVGQQPHKDELYRALEKAGLLPTHGVLHGFGVKNVAKLVQLPPHYLEQLNLRPGHLRRLNKLINDLKHSVTTLEAASEAGSYLNFFLRHTVMEMPGYFNLEPKPQMEITNVCPEYGIFKARLLTEEQCDQLVRMAEVFAYNTTGWRPEIYTLTNLDLHVRAIPGMMDIVDPLMQYIMLRCEDIFGCVPGSVKYRNDNEPHLVKYNGINHKGVCMHTDSAELTLNVALSDPAEDFDGGGTYFEGPDETMKLRKGEILLHKGELKHKGVEVTSGVRIILVSFMNCSW